MSYKASMACAGAFAAAATLAGTAFAAEPAPPPPPVPVFTWTGLYLGGQIGYAWGNDNFFYGAFDPLTGLAFTPSVFSSPSGVIGGAHVGFNYQIDKPSGGFVLGVEGLVDGTSLSNTVAAGLPAFGGSSVSASTNTDIQGSIRGRFGIAWDRLLAYATGGVAFGGFNTSFSTSGNNGGNPFNASDSFSNTRVGWTAGGGIDYAVANNWSVFAEYRYTDFGTVGNTQLATAVFRTVPGLTGGTLSVVRTLSQSQVQVGFSYKFDSSLPAPDFSMF
ncbi:MAG: autotransporter outer membrane beta-barrel domain-containing protein [Beijerinckiaceae bacterium]|nr:MAG: autotransporter outer membrane beta-barrel domain-containing protein [Beijerinckiaceae bacterium]